MNSWSLASGTLPPGLTLASNGVISGTPTQSGTFNFTVQANGNGTSDTRGLSIFVLAPLELQTLAGKKPPTTGLDGQDGRQRRADDRRQGGRRSRRRTRSPRAASCRRASPSTRRPGALTGSGTTAGRYSTTITVTDATGAKISVPWSFTILPLLDFAKGKGLPSGR